MVTTYGHVISIRMPPAPYAATLALSYHHVREFYTASGALRAEHDLCVYVCMYKLHTMGKYLRARYFSNAFTRKGLALRHLQNCPLRTDNPWGPQAGAELRGLDLQRATNNMCIALRLPQPGAQSKDGLIQEFTAVFQLKRFTD